MWFLCNLLFFFFQICAQHSIYWIEIGMDASRQMSCSLCWRILALMCVMKSYMISYARQAIQVSECATCAQVYSCCWLPATCSSRNEQSTQVEQWVGRAANKLLEFLVILRGKLQQFAQSVEGRGVCRLEESVWGRVCVFVCLRSVCVCLNNMLYLNEAANCWRCASKSRSA